MEREGQYMLNFYLSKSNVIRSSNKCQVTDLLTKQPTNQTAKGGGGQVDVSRFV